MPAFANELSKRDEIAMRQLAVEADARWDARDAAGLSELFSEDATLDIPGRAAASTREGIREYFARSFAQLDPAMRYLTLLSGVHPVAEEVVFADGKVRFDKVSPDGVRELVRDFVSHTVLVGEAGGWKFKATRAHVHPNEEAPPAL